MWMKLVVCNILPTRHETTLGVDHILLINALMKEMTISLPGFMNIAMNNDPTKSKRGWDFQCSKSTTFFPHGLWKEEREAAENPIPPPMLSPVRPPVTHTDIPASSTRSSPQPIRKELMRALRQVSEHQQQPAGDLEDVAGSDEDGSDEDSSKE
ncbi:hypothetical protein PIB30_080020 [Stylosanthes scabra]|uniref:Uncharacterized protein n=1 Tax=Stylosanthes scabra TaxID=79078 RepID=A0ABU6WQZ8_9FABA|nr:hypothetical protein [Stylosanthes scabra]